MPHHHPAGTSGEPAPQGLLQRIEAYYDAVPRAAARAEVLGPLTLFVKEGPGWPYYARPSLGAGQVRAHDVDAVRRRQRELGVPEAFEWVAEVTPSLRAAVTATGMRAHPHPLMVLDGGAPRLTAAPPPWAAVVPVGPGDDLARVNAVAELGFAAAGTAVGDAGVEALHEAAAGADAAALAAQRERLERGLTVTVAAMRDGDPVAVGSHQPVDGVTEIVGVATLPALRRRGLAAAVTAALVDDALARGVRLVFLSAGDDAVARVYARLGFREVATAWIADPADPAEPG